MSILHNIPEYGYIDIIAGIYKAEQQQLNKHSLLPFLFNKMSMFYQVLISV